MIWANQQYRISTDTIDRSHFCREDNMVPRVGQTAPDFTLKDHNEATVSLSDYRGRKNVVVAFFPLAWTPI